MTPSGSSPELDGDVLATRTTSPVTRSAGRSSLKTHWFDHWHPDLDGALAVLPEMETCPNELYRLIGDPEDSLVPKRIALLTDGDQPMAVIALRRELRRWTPVTTWVVPGALFPIDDGNILRALRALRPLDAPLFMSWWRQSVAPPYSLRMTLAALPTYQLELTSDYEALWQETGLMSDIRKARKRCVRFNLEINAPGAAEWTIRSWGQKWATAGLAEQPEMRDKLIVARYWEQRGRHVCLSLRDGDQFIAGDTSFVHGRDLVGLNHYRDEGYGRCGLGNRLLDAATSFAAERDFRYHDFGGGYEYKKQWARQIGTRWQFTFDASRIPVWTVANKMWHQMRRVRDHLRSWQAGNYCLTSMIYTLISV